MNSNFDATKKDCQSSIVSHSCSKSFNTKFEKNGINLYKKNNKKEITKVYIYN